MPSIGDEKHQLLMDDCLDDSTKIIRYMEEKARQQRLYNIAILVLTAISAIVGIISLLD